jgi:hypothetical protein
MHVRLSGRNYLSKYCGPMWIPVVDCRKNQTDECRMAERRCSCSLGLDPLEQSDEGDSTWEIKDANPHYTPCAVCLHDRTLSHNYRGSYWYKKRSQVDPLTWRDGLRTGKRFMKHLRGGKDFQLLCVPNSTMSVSQIEGQLDIWEASHNFVPDVIVVDYADILAPEDRRVEFRHQENEKWKALRRLSQSRHCLVITATQADAAAYEKKLLRQKNFSEDKRKYAHVTGMLGINQTDEEKRRGLMRLNWLMLREGEFTVKRVVTVLQCLAIGRPVLGSF